MNDRSAGNGRRRALWRGERGIDFASLTAIFVAVGLMLVIPDWFESLESIFSFTVAAAVIGALNIREYLRAGRVVSPTLAALLIVQFYLVFGPLWVALSGRVPRPRTVDLVFNGPAWEYSLAACTTAGLFLWLGYIGSFVVRPAPLLRGTRLVPPSAAGLWIGAGALVAFLAIVLVGLGADFFAGQYGALFVATSDRTIASLWVFAEYSIAVGSLHYIIVSDGRLSLRNPALVVLLVYGMIALALGMRQRLLGASLAAFLALYPQMNKTRLPAWGPLLVLASLPLLLLVDVGRTLPGGVVGNIVNGTSLRVLVDEGAAEVVERLTYTACEPTSVTARTVSKYGTEGTDGGLFYLLLPQLLLPRELRPFELPHQEINTDIAFDTIEWARHTNYTMGGSPVAEAIRSMGGFGVIMLAGIGFLFRLVRDAETIGRPSWARLTVVCLPMILPLVARNSITYYRGVALATLFSLAVHWVAQRRRKRSKSYPMAGLHDVSPRP
jgi:hypothetical protein